jgi:hypothetical protein
MTGQGPVHHAFGHLQQIPVRIPRFAEYRMLDNQVASLIVEQRMPAPVRDLAIRGMSILVQRHREKHRSLFTRCKCSRRIVLEHDLAHLSVAFGFRGLVRGGDWLRKQQCGRK